MGNSYNWDDWTCFSVIGFWIKKLKPKSAEAARNTQKGTPPQDGIGPFAIWQGCLAKDFIFITGQSVIRIN